MPTVTVSDVKSHLNITFSDDDALIGAQIAAAVKRLESELGKAFETQSRLVSFDCWSRSLPLPISPIQSITEIHYMDPDFSEQTLPPENYVLHVDGDGCGTVYIKDGVSLPALAMIGGAVMVEYVAGWGAEISDGEFENDLPADIREAIKRLAAAFYEDREGTGSIPPGISDLIAPYRSYVF
jgi:uncharacterized phiE125 gp8 family phage protein